MVSPSTRRRHCWSVIRAVLAAVLSCRLAGAQTPPAPGVHHPPRHPAHPLRRAPHHPGHGRGLGPGHGHAAAPGHHPRAGTHAPKPIPVPVPAPAPAPAPAVPPAPPPVEKGRNSGLPLPRFAALRSDEVNMRKGPGTQYPILWLYKRRDLPVEITREFDNWRLVVDSDHVTGWILHPMLTGNRTFMVTATAHVTVADADRGPGTLLLDEARDDAGVVAILRPGVIGRLRECPPRSAWCRVTALNYRGWLQRSAIFGLLPDEVIQPP